MTTEIALDDLVVVVMAHGATTLIEAADWPFVRTLKLHLGTNGYANCRHPRTKRGTTLHRVLLAPPPGTHVDHINGDKLDNRRTNLRVVTPSLNQFNRSELNRNNTSGARGVSFTPSLSRLKPWSAQIVEAGKKRHLGLFASREQAIAARKAAEDALLGDFERPARAAAVFATRELKTA